jgi:hypothetical protein
MAYHNLSNSIGNRLARRQLMNRRTTLFSLFASAAVLLAPRPGRAAALPPLEVYRNPGCGCCEGWVRHMIAVASR